MLLLPTYCPFDLDALCSFLMAFLTGDEMSADNLGGKPYGEWEFIRRKPLGSREVMDLYDVDIGFGNMIADALHGVTVKDDTLPRNANAVDFFKRPPSQQIYYGQYETPSEFVQKLMATDKGRKDDQKAVNKNAFPLIYFYRDPMVASAEHDSYKPIHNYATIYEDALERKPIAEVSKFPVGLSFNITIVAWEKATLSRIAMALTSYLTFYGSPSPDDSKRKGRRNHFKVKTKLWDTEIESDCEVVSPASIAFDNQSLSSGEDRLLALSANIEVIADVYEVCSYEYIKGRLRFHNEIIGEHNK